MARKRERQQAAQTKDQTIAVLQEAIAQRNGDYTILLDRLHRAEETNTLLIQQATEHATVLQGDRDALTRALEVCTRRLASPMADRDPRRAGWRAANALHVVDPLQQILDQKATDPQGAGRFVGTPSLQSAIRGGKPRG